MDIKNLSNSVNPGRANEVNKPLDRGTSPQNASSSAADAGDRVTLTDKLAQARELELKSQDVRVDNSEKIAAIKAAIAEGSYQVDAQKVADKLLQTEVLFAKN